ncbi:MAG TPA: asparaginase [Planctomycetota bacterium]|nr:asparaginase [Planctomycetota bacterium]
MNAPILVTATRGGLPESRHRVSVAAIEGGRTVLALGDIASPVFTRSSAKPFQALEFVLSGAADRFGVTDEELAVVCASHGAEECHLDAVRSLLRKGGLTEAALGCGAHAPACTRASVALAKSGARPTVLHNNCSGKHSGMVMTAKHIGAPVEGYLDPAHPLQVANRRNLALFAGVDPASIAIGVDGCSAPNFALPLEAQARAFARLAEPDASIPKAHADAARRIVRAMTGFPRQVAWEGEGDAALMGAAPGRLVSKLGAEGVQGVGVPGRGLGIVIKVEDGGARPRLPVTVALLRAAGVLSAAEAARVGPPADVVLRNHRGTEVGRIEFDLPDAVRALAR